MNNRNFKYPDTRAYSFVVNRLQERGVELEGLVDVIYQTQKEFEPALTVKLCREY